MDIIIPVLNEESLLLKKRDYFERLKTKARIIFVDGGSQDQTQQTARQYGEVIGAARGRGPQKNQGAAWAKSNDLLFLHVDTEIDPEALEGVQKVLSQDVCAGCFTMSIDDHSWIFRVFEGIINFRARYSKMLDGDLGLFIKRKIFQQIGTFDALPYMEDILFSNKLRQAGKVVVLPDKILVSSRKWHEDGFLKTFCQYTRAYSCFWLRGIFPSHKER